MLSITNDEYILFMVTMLFVGIGVVGKDYTNDKSGKDKGIRLFRIVFVMVVLSLLMLSFKDFWARFNQFFYFFLCVVAGWMNYSLPKFLDSTGEKLMKFFEDRMVQIFGKKETDIDDIMDEMKKMNKRLDDLSDKDDEDKEENNSE